MTGQRGDRLHRWTARVLATGAGAGSALASGPAAAAPPDGAPALASGDVVVTGVASVTLLLLLAGAVLVAVPRLFRLVRSRFLGSR
ncbi:hypothetical protein [Dactylosporangium sp. NPDC048998]|uniref:hypothetical protein n=1 Tax=Dactylosporangium sp. NPDC048998 TaxID=3363976 RepID=UPI003722AB54